MRKPLATVERKWRLIWWAVLILALVPLGALAWRAGAGDLGANPIEAIIRNLGDWAIRFVLIGLALTPLRQMTGAGDLIRFRRLIGLVAFAYVTLHLLSYVVLDHFFDWAEIGADIVKRPYITFGMTAFAILIALAVTSTDASARRMGARNWRRLHASIYAAAALGVLHFDLLVKADARQPHLYAAILAAFLGWRVYARVKKNVAKTGARRTAGPPLRRPD